MTVKQEMPYTDAQDRRLQEAMCRAGVPSSRARGQWDDSKARANYNLKQYRIDHGAWHAFTMTSCGESCPFKESGERHEDR